MYNQTSYIEHKADWGLIKCDENAGTMPRTKEDFEGLEEVSKREVGLIINDNSALVS